MAMQNRNLTNGSKPTGTRGMVSFKEIATELDVRPEAVAAIVRKRLIPCTTRPPFVFVDAKHLDEIRGVLSPPADRLIGNR